MMIGFLKSTIKAASAVIDIPVAIVADTVTLRGLLTDKETSYTGDACGRLVDNVKDMADPDK
jgi:hypothetical protein